MKQSQTNPANVIITQQVPKRTQKRTPQLLVTSPGFDDIGALLSKMNLSFRPFKGDFDCDILFVNCGTSDDIDAQPLRNYVSRGGCVYISDQMSSLVEDAFPELFDFEGNSGMPGQIEARIVDKEIVEVMGETLNITFDMGAWSILKSVTEGKTILLSCETQKPLMVRVSFGKGTVFYTCFHNHAQTSELEQILLQLLVLKQLGTVMGMTLRQASKLSSVNIESIKNQVSKGQ